MITPTTYSEWTKLLDQFGHGDDSVLEGLSKGTFIIDAGTATRFYNKVEEVYKKRKENWLDKFQRSFEWENFKTEDDFGIALRNAKQNLSPLCKFVSIKGLPDNLKEALKKDLEIFVNEIKTTLKKNNEKISKGREKILLLLNSFDLINTSEDILMNLKSDKKNTTEIIASTGRKIIF